MRPKNQRPRNQRPKSQRLKSLRRSLRPKSLREAMAPALKAFRLESKDLKLRKVNVDEAPRTAERLGVRRCQAEPCRRPEASPGWWAAGCI